MTISHRLRFIVLILVWLLTATGCFEFQQTLYVNADGSGRTELKYALPLNLLDSVKTQGPVGIPLTKEQLQAQFGSRPGLTILGGSFRVEETLKVVEIMLEFDNIENLSQSGIVYEWYTDGDERVMRMVVERKPQNIKINEIHKMLIKGLTDSGAHITVYLPRRVSWSNADKADGNTVRWFLPAGWLLDPNAGPRTLEARYKITTVERVQGWFEDLF